MSTKIQCRKAELQLMQNKTKILNFSKISSIKIFGKLNKKKRLHLLKNIIQTDAKIKFI